MKIKIFQDEIDIKFTNEEFIETKKNLENVHKNETIKIKEFIDSTIKSMKKVYDNLLNDIKEGNIKDYEKSLKETSGKIEEYKFDLENKINNEIPNFRKKLLLQLNFITERLKKIKVNKGNLNSFGLFQSIYEAEEKVITKTMDIMGKGSLGILALDLGLIGFSTATTIAVEGVAVAGEAFSGFLSWSSLASFGIGCGIGAAIGIGIPLVIHGGFALYKKIVEKKRYIELISNAKIELEKSLASYEENINLILRKITNEIEMAVKKFFAIQNVKLEGIKKHIDDWLALREQIINCLQN